DQGARDELPVLNEERLIEPPFVAHAGDVFRHRLFAQQERDRVAGREVHEEKRDEGDAEKNRYRTDEAPSDHGAREVTGPIARTSGRELGARDRLDLYRR